MVYDEMRSIYCNSTQAVSQPARPLSVLHLLCFYLSMMLHLNRNINDDDALLTSAQFKQIHW